MEQTTRGRISVDIGRLRAALFERARSKGVSPSHLIRDIVAKELAGGGEISLDGANRPPPDAVRRVRRSLRLSLVDALRLQRAARHAGKSLGDMVMDLLDGAPAAASGEERQAQLRALVASNSELATLSRDLRHLSTLLRRGSVAAAQRYRDLLDTVASDARRHVDISSAALAEVVPARRLLTASNTRKRDE
jgi:hypothetical protein